MQPQKEGGMYHYSKQKDLLKFLKYPLLYVMSKTVLSANAGLYIIPPLPDISLEVLPIRALKLYSSISMGGRITVNQ